MPKVTAVFDADDSRLSGALARINGKMLAQGSAHSDVRLALERVLSGLDVDQFDGTTLFAKLTPSQKVRGGPRETASFIGRRAAGIGRRSAGVDGVRFPFAAFFPAAPPHVIHSRLKIPNGSPAARVAKEPV
jgi:hypothetical protein